MKTLMDGISKFEIPFDNKVHKVIHVIMELPTPVSNREMVVVNTKMKATRSMSETAAVTIQLRQTKTQ